MSRPARERAPRSSRSSAARRWARVSSSAAHLLEHGGANDRVGELERVLVTRRSARTRALAAVSAAPGSSPASAAASGSSVRSPRIAAARKRSVASVGRRARRVETPYETLGARARALRRVLGGRRETLPPDCVEQRDQVERVPARAGLERGGERRCRLVAEPLTRKRRRRLLAQTAEPHHDAGGVGDEFLDKRREIGLLGRTRAEKKQDAEDLRGGGTSNEASAATARRTSAGRRRRAASVSATRSSRSASRGHAASRTRTRPPLGDALVGAEAKSDALNSAAPANNSARNSGVAAAASDASNSCRTIPNANSPSSSPPRALSTSKPAACGKRARLREQPRLPDPGAALDDHHPAVTYACCGEHRLQRSQLRLPLEQAKRSDRPCQLACHHRDPPRIPSRGARERKASPQAGSRDRRTASAWSGRSSDLQTTVTAKRG